MEGEALKTRHVYHWRGPKGGRRQYVTEQDGGKRRISWETGSRNLPAKWHLLFVSEPKQDRNKKLVVVCHGARAAESISAAGYLAIGTPETTRTDKAAVEWLVERVQGREFVFWPAKTELSHQAMWDVFNALPGSAGTRTFASIESLEEGQDAHGLDPVRVVECIQARGRPGPTPDPEKTTPKEIHSGTPEPVSKIPLDVWSTNADDQIARDSTHNVRSLLHREGYDLSWNALLCRAIAHRDGKEWTLRDQDLDDLIFRAYDTYGYRPNPIGNFLRFVGSIAREKSFDPIISYLEACPDPKDTDEAERAMRWLVKALGLDPDDPLDYRAVTLTLGGIIARQFHPGCPWKYMLILAGAQDCGKSAAVAALCPRKDWLRQGIENSEFRDKKTLAESTEGIIIVEAAELSAMSSKEDSAFKSRLSETKDGPYRPSHERTPISRERRYLFIGTSNKHNYLTDPTGNVRYWPTDIPEGTLCDFKGMRRRINRLWGCAMHLWVQRGEDDEARLHSLLDDARQLSRDMIGRHQMHEADDPLSEKIQEISLSLDNIREGMRMNKIMGSIGITADKQPMYAKSMGDKLRALKWKRGRNMAGKRVWFPPEGQEAEEPEDDDEVPF